MVPAGLEKVSELARQVNDPTGLVGRMTGHA
jgi:hypothetical protein